MKKFAMMLAAGVVALGASAQAASVASTDTYAVITIPIYSGNNLIGVSVEPLTGVTTLAGLTGLDPLTDVKKLNAAGTDYIEGAAGNITTFAVGDAYWVAGAGNGTTNYIYEVGTEKTNATINAVNGLTPAVVTLPYAWKLSDCSLGDSDTTARPSSAAKIHVWNPVTEKYVVYWLKRGSGWVAKADGSDASDVTVGAAQGFFFQLSAAKTITIAPPPAE